MAITTAVIEAAEAAVACLSARCWAL
jgi:hypothetical protein